MAIIMVNESTMVGQQLLKCLQFDGVTKCCLHILGRLLHYLQLQLIVIKCNYEGLLSYVGNQKSLGMLRLPTYRCLHIVVGGLPRSPRLARNSTLKHPA